MCTNHLHLKIDRFAEHFKINSRQYGSSNRKQDRAGILHRRRQWYDSRLRLHHFHLWHVANLKSLCLPGNRSAEKHVSAVAAGNITSAQNQKVPARVGPGVSENLVVKPVEAGTEAWRRDQEEERLAICVEPWPDHYRTASCK